MVEVKVIDEWISDLVKIYVIEDLGDVRRNIIIDGDNLVAKKLDRDNPIELLPFLTMNKDMFRGFQLGILEHANENGVKLESENVLSAKLSLKEEHLQDTRKHFDKVLDFILKTSTKI